MRNLRFLLTALIAGAIGSNAVGQDQWPQFRGPGGSGISAKSLPVKWDAKTNVVWSAEIPGRGWSSPIIWDNRVFVTAVLNDKTPMPRKGLYTQDLIGKIPPGEHTWKILCIDFATGKPLWDKSVYQGQPGGPIHLKNTYASETPVTDGEHVYAYFGNLGLYCCDMKGNLVWSQKFEPARTRLGWGTAASPIVHKDRVYLVNDNDDQSFLIAFDKKTGKEVWKVKREERSNWATPFVWETKERTEIVTAGSDRVRSYDLDGKLLWELKGMSIISIPTPFAGPDYVYITSGYVADIHRPLYAIKPGASGDISLKPKETSSASIAWYQKLAGPYHPTPILYDGNIYVLL